MQEFHQAINIESVSIGVLILFLTGYLEKDMLSLFSIPNS